MALSEHERYRFERPVRAFIRARRPPPHIRPPLDLGYRIAGQSVEIFETRPAFQRHDQKLESAVAKATYIKSRKVWKIYWMRADLKWHRYAPRFIVATIEDVLAVVDEDAYGYFFG